MIIFGSLNRTIVVKVFNTFDFVELSESVILSRILRFCFHKIFFEVNLVLLLDSTLYRRNIILKIYLVRSRTILVYVVGGVVFSEVQQIELFLL